MAAGAPKLVRTHKPELLAVASTMTRVSPPEF
jgi:hypothetical protein